MEQLVMVLVLEGGNTAVWGSVKVNVSVPEQLQ